MVNIDAINPDWPHPIHLPDEEETLDKQVSSGAVVARERGLVPQSGDWEHPYRWVTPEEVEEIEAPKQLSTSTLVEGSVQDTETGRTKIVPRKSKAEGGGPPTHLYRVMDKRQYDDAIKDGKLKPAPDGDRRIYAAGKPSFQYAEPSPTVLVAIEYSDDDGWKAQSGLSEVTATTENPIPISKVKVIAEGANKRELLANYALVADTLSPESESYETVDLEYARENLSPFSVRNNKGTNAKKQLENILDSDVESVTVWHGTTLGGAKKILEDGMIRGYGGFGAGVTLDPHRAYTYTRGQKSVYDLPDKDKYPVVMQFEIPKDMFRNFTPEIGGLGKDELLFNPWGAATYRSESFVSLPDEYKNSEGDFPSHREKDIPLTIDVDSVKFITSEDVDIPAPEITKQAGAVAARQRGLVPQSGDWNRPYRWVTPEEVEEEETKSPKEVGRIKQPWEMTQKEFESPAPLPQPKPGNIILYHTTEEKNLDSILRDGFDSTRWGGEGPQGVVWGVDSPEGYSSGGVVIGFEVPESRLRTDKDAKWKYVSGNVSPDDIVYVDTPSKYSGHGRMRYERDSEYAKKYHALHVKEAIGDGKPVPDEVLRDYPDLIQDTSSSYEMPKYDMSWDALVETEFKGKELNFIPITDEMRTTGYISNLIEDTDNIVLPIDNSIYFGESEDDVKDKVLKEYTEGKYVSSYYPPRLTPKPEWATDENNPFPEIPSDVKEIHYDDIPEFYAKHKYGDALQQFGSLKGIARKISEIAGMHSEPFYEALDCVDGELDYDHAADVFSQELEENVTEKQAKLALNRLRDMTQKSLENRGLPEKFYVFRGGKVHDNDKPMPTSLNVGTAAKSYFSQKRGEPYVAMYEVNRDDVLLDMNSMKSEAQGEEELIILGRNLKNPRMVRLPNKDITNPEFHKSKSLDKQAVATSEPPDLSVAARMKARGLEWKKETHRWVRPEDAEEEKEPQIHELIGDRDAYFKALMDRHDDITGWDSDLQRDYLNYIKDSLDEKLDRTLHMLGGPTLSEASARDIEIFLREQLSLTLLAEIRRDALNKLAETVEIRYGKSGDEIKESDFHGLDDVSLPYILSQISEFGKKVSSDEETDMGTIHPIHSRLFMLTRSAIDASTLQMGRTNSGSKSDDQSGEFANFYIEGLLDINDKYLSTDDLKRGIGKNIDYFLNREELEKTLQFSRDNLFKLIKRGDKLGTATDLVSKVYEVSSPKDKAFMREALLNSLKDAELVSQIHSDFVGNATSVDTQDVIAGINHLALAIYEDMLKNGDIDDLGKFFSDENIPTGLFHKHEYEAMPFHFLTQHMSVDEFDSHVDTFLSGGEILRKAGIESLSYIDPSHPSLLAMVDTEDNPDVMNLLARRIPVTALSELWERTSRMTFEDIDERFQEEMEAYAKEHEILGWIISPDNEAYEEYREERGKQIAYANKAIALDKRAKSVFDNASRNAMQRLEIMDNVSMEMESIEEFHALFKEENEDKAHLLMEHWANNVSDEFAEILETGFGDEYHKPGLPKVFDELYYGTPFGKMHTLSKGAWEASSSSGWGGVLKESVGRQFDDKVIYHSDRRTRDSIDEALEREREMLFKPDDIRSANFTQESLDKYVRMHKSLTRALLDIAVPDSDTIEVFRGTSDNELDETDYHSLRQDSYESASIKSNSLSSYSMNEHTASEGFAESKDSGVVINVPELHKDKIWSTFLSHSYEGGEREILVINHSDVDAYARSTEEPIDTDQFNPDFLDSSSIEDMYGIHGFTDNDYIDEFGNVSALEKHILGEINAGNNSYFEDYMNSSHYDSYMVQEWAAGAAQQIMDWSEENYDYTINIPSEQEEAIEIVENFGFLGRITHPEHVLDNYPLPDGYKSLSQNIFDKQKQLWEEGGETHVAVIDEADEEELAEEADRIAINIMEWAEQGQSKVSRI